MADVISLRPKPDLPIHGEQEEVVALLDVPTMLRRLAADLEAGEYDVREAKATFGAETIIRAAVVVRVSGQPIAVGGYGKTHVAQTYMDLCAGAQELMNTSHPERSS